MSWSLLFLYAKIFNNKTRIYNQDIHTLLNSENEVNVYYKNQDTMGYNSESGYVIEPGCGVK